MKSFVAIALAVRARICRTRIAHTAAFCFLDHEEVGCIGVGRLIADLAGTGIKPRSCIVGEPTLMRPVIAHKGKKGFRCLVRGYSCHSGVCTVRVNAVEAAAEAIAFLKAMARRHRDHGPYDRGFDVAHTTVHTGVIRVELR